MWGPVDWSYLQPLASRSHRLDMLYMHTGVLKALCSLKVPPSVFFLVEEQMQGSLRPPPPLSQYIIQQLGSFTFRRTIVPRLLSASCIFFLIYIGMMEKRSNFRANKGGCDSPALRDLATLPIWQLMGFLPLTTSEVAFSHTCWQFPGYLYQMMSLK